jgi:hypothetical protein
MKKILGSVALIGLLATALAPAAHAQCTTGTGTNILLNWGGNGFSYESPAPVTNYVSPAGNSLSNVLAVALFCSPLNTLDPNDPAFEYTMVWSGLTSGGTVTAPFGASGSKYTTLYLGGTWALYKGPINARAYTGGTIPAPALALPNYTDGSVILSGTIDSLTTVVTKSSLGTVSGSFRGRYRITGGPMANLFCAAASGLMDGLWDPNSAPVGYTSHDNGKFDSPDCTTGAPSTTWGRLKVLYR